MSFPFEACNLCYQKYLQYVKKADWKISPSASPCSDCYGFSLEQLLKYSVYCSPIITIPDAESAPGFHLNTKPGVLTNVMLLNAWIYAQNRFAVQKNWLIKNVKDYFKMLCLNNETFSIFISECKTFMNYQKCINHPSDNLDNLTEELQDLIKRPDNPELLSPPPMWHICPIYLVVETSMHLQMNLIHNNNTFIITWAKTIAKGEHLKRELTKHLVKVRQCNVSGFKVIPVRTNHFGGYVAENLKALLKLSPWCFKFLDEEAMQPKTEVTMPE